MTTYDVAVAGAGFGGLAAAALLAHAGKKAILLEPDREIGGVLAVYGKDGFRFTTGPTLSFGFERGGAIERLSAELGVAQGASVPSLVYQVALPDRRVNIYAESGETLEELVREFRSEISALKKFYRDIRKKARESAKSRLSASILRRRRAGAFLARYRFSREFTAFLDVQALFFFGRPASELSLASLVTLTDAAPVAVDGGFRKFAERMLDVFLARGGEVRYGTPWPEPARAPGNRTALATPGGPAEAGAVLFNCPRERQGATLFIALRSEVIPVGMSRNVICLPDYARPRDFFSLSLSSADDESSAPRGMRALTASFPSVSVPSAMQDALIPRINAIIPFLDRYLVFAHEHRPLPRAFDFRGMTFKPVRTGGHRPLLSKVPSRRVYFIPDDSGAIIPAVYAARKFADMVL